MTAPDKLTYEMPLTIRTPVYDESMPEIEDGGYVTMREAVEAEDTPATRVATPPPVTVFDDMTLPPAPPALVRQRAVAVFDDEGLPIRSLLGEFVPMGETLDPVVPVWANGLPPFEPNDINNPINPNRLAMM
jgi:hypothetical protein